MSSLSNAASPLSGVEPSLLGVFDVILPMCGMMILIYGGVKLVRAATNPDFNMADAIIPIMIGIFFFSFSNIISFTEDTLEPVAKKEHIEQNKSSIVKENTQKHSNSVVKSKPVDYKPFLIIMGYIFGGIILLVLTSILSVFLWGIFAYNKLKRKVVSMLELPNNFITLSNNIDTIDNLLIKINLFSKDLYGDKKTEMYKLKKLLEDKKDVFNSMIKSIHEALDPNIMSLS